MSRVLCETRTRAKTGTIHGQVHTQTQTQTQTNTNTDTDTDTDTDPDPDLLKGSELT